MPIFDRRDDGTRRRERRQGSRIYQGLGELGNLDATEPKKKGPRVERSNKVSEAAAESGESGHKALTSPTAPPSITAGVFGTWEEWRSVFKTLFPTPNPTVPSISATAELLAKRSTAISPTSSSSADLCTADSQQTAGGSKPSAATGKSPQQQRISLLHSLLQKLDSLDSKALQGLASIDMWRLRSQSVSSSSSASFGGSNRVPRYVEATAVLAEAQMMDRTLIKSELYAQIEAEKSSIASSTQQPPSASTTSTLNTFVSASNALAVVRPTAVANSYGGAISRALHILTGGLIRSNSFVDEETSYRSRANEIGVPEEAVEVRRRVAHGNMPLLSELRLTAALVMEHLYDRYWCLQESQLKKLLREDERDAKKRSREERVPLASGAANTGNSSKKNAKKQNAKGGKGQSSLSGKEEGSNTKKSVRAKDVLALLAELSDIESADEAGECRAESEESFVEGI